MRRFFLFLARILMSVIFLVSAAHQCINWSDTVEGLVMAFCHWHLHLDGVSYGDNFIQFCISISPLLMGIGVFLEFVGGVLILLGIKLRLGAFLLLVFTLPVTFLYHPFWFDIGESFQVQIAMFLKNLFMCGAFLYLLVAPQHKQNSTP